MGTDGSTGAPALAESLSGALSDRPDLFGESGACPVAIEAGNPRFVVVTGENAGGKSFLVRYLSQSQPREVEVIPISIRLRTSPGMQRGMVFGDETRSSTGQVSARVVQTALKTIRERGTPTLLVLDEPDLGLGVGYQVAMGEMITAFARDLPTSTVGVAVVTHCRGMVSRMLVASPTLVRVGDDLRPTGRWLRDGDMPRTVDDLLALSDRSRHRRSAIQAAQNAAMADDAVAGSPPSPRR